MTGRGEEATLVRGTVVRDVEQVRDELDAHAGPLGDDEVREVTDDQDVRLRGDTGELRRVVRRVDRTTEQRADAGSREVDRVVRARTRGRETTDLVLDVGVHDPRRVGAVPLGERLPRLEHVDRTERPVGGHDDHDVGVRLERREDTERLRGAGTGDRLRRHEVDVPLVEEGTHLGGETDVVGTDLRRERDEPAGRVDGDVRLGERRAVVRHGHGLTVVGPRGPRRRDALPLVRGDRDHAGEVEDRGRSGTARQDDGGVDEDRDAEATGGVHTLAHRTELVDRTDLVRVERGHRLADRLGERRTVRVGLGDEHPLRDHATVGVRGLRAEELVDVVLLVGGEATTLGLEDLQGRVAQFTAGGGTQVERGGLDSLEDRRAVDAGVTLGRSGLGGLDADGAGLELVELGLAGLERLEGRGELLVVLGGDVVDLGEADHGGPDLRDLGTQFVQVHGIS